MYSYVLRQFHLPLFHFPNTEYYYAPFTIYKFQCFSIIIIGTSFEKLSIYEMNGTFNSL